MTPTEWAPFVEHVEGRFVAASNATLLGETRDGERVVYKPIAGERPLWDFPSETLAIREVLTYQMSEMLGLHVVPETVYGDGVFGPGSVQRFVDIDESWDAVPSIQDSDDDLWPIAVLDMVCNNADRKVGHILRSSTGRLIAIDHGLTFHHSDKLRTVLWGFAGRALPDKLAAPVAAMANAVEIPRIFATHLEPNELRSLEHRLAAIAAHAVHPQPPTDRPAMPWPLY